MRVLQRLSGALLFVSMSLATSASASTSPSTVVTSNTVVHGFFRHDVSLDHGALTITPVAGAPVVSATIRRQLQWAAGSWPAASIKASGVGVVTIDASRTATTQQPRVTALRHEVAAIALIHVDSTYSCPMRLTSGPYTTQVPVSQGWSAVIVPLDPTKSDAVFTASSLICGRVRRNAVVTATYNESVNWHLGNDGTRPVIVVSVPACGVISETGGGGNERSRVFSFGAVATVIDRPLTRCSPATTVDEGPNYASPTTTHRRTGVNVSW